MRPGVAKIPPYEAGRPIEEVARSIGLDPATVVKLASNESPLPPFPEVIEAIAAAAAGSNRYPDNDWFRLAEAVAGRLQIEPDHLMFGGGTSRAASCHLPGGGRGGNQRGISVAVIHHLSHGHGAGREHTDRGAPHARLSPRPRRNGWCRSERHHRRLFMQSQQPDRDSSLRSGRDRFHRLDTAAHAGGG